MILLEAARRRIAPTGQSPSAAYCSLAALHMQKIGVCLAEEEVLAGTYHVDLVPDVNACPVLAGLKAKKLRKHRKIPVAISLLVSFLLVGLL